MRAPIPRMPDIGCLDAQQQLPFGPVWSPLVPSQSTLPAERPISTHPAFDRLLARVPPLVSVTFTREQILALVAASVPVRHEHAIDYRLSIPLFKKRFYLTILGGKERRSRQRLLAENQMFLSETVMFQYFLAGTIMLTICAVLVLFGFGMMADEQDIHTQSSLQRIMQRDR